MHLLTDKYPPAYRQQLPTNISSALKSIDAIELNPQSFTFYTSVAVISSSRIEGEKMEVDSYVKHKTQNIEYLPELTQKPDDLYQAYVFAQGHELSRDNFLQAHRLIAAHLLPEPARGAYRKTEMVVMEHNTGRIQFEAAPYATIPAEMDKLWADIGDLLQKELPAEEVFYYAAFIHMVFVCIHPFNDGNGRAGRLLEKWFLAAKLGPHAWYIPSEKYYYAHVSDYYKNLNRLGIFYDQLDYSHSLPFLLMLPGALTT